MMSKLADAQKKKIHFNNFSLKKGKKKVKQLIFQKLLSSVMQTLEDAVN